MHTCLEINMQVHTPLLTHLPTHTVTSSRRELVRAGGRLLNHLLFTLVALRCACWVRPGVVTYAPCVVVYPNTCNQSNSTLSQT